MKVLEETNVEAAMLFPWPPQDGERIIVAASKEQLMEARVHRPKSKAVLDSTACSEFGFDIMQTPTRISSLPSSDTSSQRQDIGGPRPYS